MERLTDLPWARLMSLTLLEVVIFSIERVPGGPDVCAASTIKEVTCDE